MDCQSALTSHNGRGITEIFADVFCIRSFIQLRAIPFTSYLRMIHLCKFRITIGLCLLLQTHHTCTSLISYSCASEQMLAAASSRFRVATAPLTLAVAFPLSGRLGDLHTLEYTHAGRTISYIPIVDGSAYVCTAQDSGAISINNVIIGAIIENGYFTLFCSEYTGIKHCYICFKG